MRSRPNTGWLISATGVLVLHCGDEIRYAMLKRDGDAPVSPNKWQIPAGRCAPGELPFETAWRELEEELGVSGALNDWSSAVVEPCLNSPVRYEIGDTVHQFNAAYACDGITVEFYFPLHVSVPSFAAIRLYDKEEYGRQTALFTPDELLQLHRQGELAEGTRVIVDTMLRLGTLEARRHPERQRGDAPAAA